MKKKNRRTKTGIKKGKWTKQFRRWHITRNKTGTRCGWRSTQKPHCLTT